MRLSFLTIFLSASFSLLAQTPSQPDVSGTWVSENHVTWILTQKDDTLHVVEMTGEKPSADFTCPLNGQSCNVKIDGHSEKMMVYFNGDRLVEILEGHAGVTKRRLTVSADGKVLTVEFVPLSSQDKSEKTVFHRGSAANSRS
jgi:hypothetical protein